MKLKCFKWEELRGTEFLPVHRNAYDEVKKSKDLDQTYARYVFSLLNEISMATDNLAYFNRLDKICITDFLDGAFAISLIGTGYNLIAHAANVDMFRKAVESKEMYNLFTAFQLFGLVHKFGHLWFNYKFVANIKETLESIGWARSLMADYDSKAQLLIEGFTNEYATLFRITTDGSVNGLPIRVIPGVVHIIDHEEIAKDAVELFELQKIAPMEFAPYFVYDRDRIKCKEEWLYWAVPEDVLKQLDVRDPINRINTILMYAGFVERFVNLMKNIAVTTSVEKIVTADQLTEDELYQLILIRCGVSLPPDVIRKMREEKTPIYEVIRIRTKIYTKMGRTCEDEVVKRQFRCPGGGGEGEKPPEKLPPPIFPPPFTPGGKTPGKGAIEDMINFKLTRLKVKVPMPPELTRISEEYRVTWKQR